MKWLYPLMLSLALLGMASWNKPIQACPNCKEAVAESSQDEGQDNPMRESRAYNYSIYFMVGMPYLLLSGLGLLIGLTVVRQRYQMPATASTPAGESKVPEPPAQD